ncbi:MAG TPA: amidohydrolase family protein [Vicinamibacterales bacterium]|nr:amidohydrolase family protein [Vicinamibacterales bacterium]
MTAPVAVRIDAHQHFWRYDPAQYEWIDDAMAALKRDCLPDEARREMASAGIDACVAVQARQTVDETRSLLALADASPAIAGVVGWIDLQAADARLQLERFADHQKLVGIRHIVQSEPDDRFMLRPAFCRGIALLEEFGLAYDILVYGRHLAAAAELAERFPSQRFVLDHLGKPDIRHGELCAWEKSLRLLADCSNVSAKLSGLVTEADWHTWSAQDIRPYLDVAFDSFGAGRLMIGSDWPVCTVAGDYTRVMALVSDYLADRPAQERDAVLGGNAQRFYNLTVTSAAETR